jgi:hypothetical protein
MVKGQRKDLLERQLIFLDPHVCFLEDSDIVKVVVAITRPHVPPSIDGRAHTLRFQAGELFSRDGLRAAGYCQRRYHQEPDFPAANDQQSLRKPGSGRSFALLSAGLSRERPTIAN